MDEKLSREGKPKVTRCRARHERRKRLISARRAAEKNPTIVTKNSKAEPEDSTVFKSPENQNGTESVSKSKARRLRKRNRIGNNINPAVNSDNNTGTDSPVSQISEYARKIPTNDICTAESKPKIDNDPKRIENDKIELNICAKKVSTTEHELLENEKNLKISESLRPIAASSNNSLVLEICKLREELKRAVTFKSIKKTDSEKKNVTSRYEESSESDKSRKILAKTGNKNDKTSNDVSLPNITKESPVELSKFSVTSEEMSSDVKMPSQEKTREQVKAEREAKKAAKAAAKNKGKIAKPETTEKIVEAPSKDLAKKTIKETNKDEVDGEIVAMTTKLMISEIKNKLETAVADTSAQVKSKAELRVERRAKQEAQRAVKQGQIPEKSKIKVTTEPIKIVTPTVKPEDPTKKIVKRPIVKENAHEVNLFKHLYHEREQSMINVPTVNSTIHPAIVRLGVQYASKVIVGSNARCVALLAAVKQLIEDFERPSQADFTRGLETSLQESSTYLHHCRPMAVSMQNALRHLKWQMTQLHATISDEEAKTKLGNAIDTYIQEQILLADKAISITIQTKISNGDVILIYGYSSLINKILCDAYDAGRQFRVVVVDGRPWLEGREQLRRLAKHGLECSYVLINALSFIMPEVSKVFLSAHAILANGAVMSRVGTAQVALMAKAFNVPVLVACETHKTCERVQTDSIVYNEIADADELAQNLMGSSKNTSLTNWRAKKSLNLLNLTYDVTPADLVTAVVTELAILPCTSVPVILRIKPSEI